MRGDPADYVVARRPLLGRVVARSHPDFFASFHVTAAVVRFSATARAPFSGRRSSRPAQ